MAILKYYPFSSKSVYSVSLESLPVEFTTNREPIPTEPKIHLGYGTNPKEYLTSGKHDVVSMLQAIESCGFSIPSNPTCLDFGCAGGRMIRHLPAHLPGGNFWGCDTEARATAWAQMYLGDEFTFFTNIREPHLPFSDNYFDFIYAGSVFSHTTDLTEFWLLELRRIIQDNGVLYITFQDDHTVEYLDKKETPNSIKYYEKIFVENESRKYFNEDYLRIVVGVSDYTAQVFYKTIRLEAMLKKMFTTVHLIPNSYGWQTGAVLQNN